MGLTFPFYKNITCIYCFDYEHLQETLPCYIIIHEDRISDWFLCTFAEYHLIVTANLHWHISHLGGNLLSLTNTMQTIGLHFF